VNCSSVKNNKKSKSEPPFENFDPNQIQFLLFKRETDPKPKVCPWLFADPEPEVRMKMPFSGEDWGCTL
jgi:hypothetical protein